MMLDRQQATALYLIDKLALRAGGEKDTDEEADTVGCCNLRVEHISTAASFFTRRALGHCLCRSRKTDGYGFPPRVAAALEDGDWVNFDFLGKDSIRYENRVQVDHQVWKNLKRFQKEPKVPGDPLFDRLTVPAAGCFASCGGFFFWLTCNDRWRPPRRRRSTST